jgi:hypothetical protein
VIFGAIAFHHRLTQRLRQVKKRETSSDTEVRR